MLSRIAESLFWIGRYIERSDGTARILGVHLQLLLEDVAVDEDTACRPLSPYGRTKLAGEDLLRDCAAWGLAKGGDLDARHAGKAALAQRLDILDAAERAGIVINLAEHGIGRIYTRAEVDALS